MKHTAHPLWISLIFFSLLCIDCTQPDAPASAVVIQKDGRAAGVSIRGLSADEKINPESISIQLVHPGERVSVLGEFKTIDDELIFEPLVPFTSGMKYEVLSGKSLFATFEIPRLESAAPELLSIYPSQDTVPENLLKIYLHFSEPMTEGRSLTFLTLIENGRDTLQGTFLDLQPELWNVESTLLTLWLDPGRIKRDLIPNKKLGAPLNAGNKYTLLLSGVWQSKKGKRMQRDLSKTFFTGQRDDNPPQPELWQLVAPDAGTRRPLEVQMFEPLDYALLQDAIQILDLQGNVVAGTIELSNKEQTLNFLPAAPWKAGSFSLNIEARLEDLAGNNLNRPFDNEIVVAGPRQQKTSFIKQFKVE